MAKVLTTSLPADIGTLYGRVMNAADQVWDGSAYVDKDSGSFAGSAKITMTDPESSGSWEGDCPAGADADAVRYEIRLKIGGSPDENDPILDSDKFNGSSGSGGGGNTYETDENSYSDD